MLTYALAGFSAWWVAKDGDVPSSLGASLKFLHIPYLHSSETPSSGLEDGADIIFSLFQG